MTNPSEETVSELIDQINELWAFMNVHPDGGPRDEWPSGRDCVEVLGHFVAWCELNDLIRPETSCKATITDDEREQLAAEVVDLWRRIRREGMSAADTCSQLYEILGRAGLPVE